MAAIQEARSPLDDVREAAKQGVLLGLGGLGDAKPRVDIDVLIKTKPMTFNLFALALADLQKNNDQNNKDPMGYFQLAGIHGLPTSDWDNVRAFDEDGNLINKPFRGYCAHGRVTFPTWHRAYLALYEQALYLKMAEIANSFPESVREDYLTALVDFRLPYWDYYRAREKKDTYFPGITQDDDLTMYPYDFAAPKVFTLTHIMVRQTSDNSLVPIPNPFYRYAHPGFSGEDWKEPEAHGVPENSFTVKNPTKEKDTDGNPVGMNRNINHDRMENIRTIRGMIMNDGNKWSYEVFATKGKEGSNPASNLEALHDQYHGLLGGEASDKGRTIRGWMGYVPTAGFDPVFWIHHCQIDRLAAIWQAANPDNWTDTDAGKKSLGNAARPFRKSRTNAKEEFWNGDDVKKTQRYGYFYEDAFGPNLPGKGDVKNRFKKLYDWSIRRTTAGETGTPPSCMVPLDLSDAQIYNYDRKGTPLPLEPPGPVLGDQPQLIMSAVQSATSAISSVVTATGDTGSSSYATEPDNAALTVSTDPRKPGDESSLAWTNPTDTTDAVSAQIDESKYYRDWYLDNVVERLAFNGPFSIFYFIGKFDKENVAGYRKQPTLAGFTYVFTSSRELCDNCGDLGDVHQLVTDTSPITSLLLDFVGRGLDDLTPDKVVPFLIQNLKWRIVSADGQLRDPRTTPGFKVGVSSKLEPIDDDDGPSDSIYEDYPQVVEEIIRRGNPSNTSS